LQDALSAIGDAGGWLLSHTLFSNMAATLRGEIPQSGLGTLRDSLQSAGVKLDDESLARISAASPPASLIGTDRLVVLSITFLHNQPDLRQDVPAVPG
jgi:hypothetical protein